jgi:hypothetical protein
MMASACSWRIAAEAAGAPCRLQAVHLRLDRRELFRHVLLADLADLGKGGAEFGQRFLGRFFLARAGGHRYGNQGDGGEPGERDRADHGRLLGKPVVLQTPRRA